MGEHSIIGPDLIRGTFEKVDLIWKRLLTAQSLQKSYVDRRCQPLEFEMGDHIFLKVMHKREVVRFDKREKLVPRYIGPFEVLKRMGTTYRLALPLVYRVSMRCSMSPCSGSILQIHLM